MIDTLLLLSGSDIPFPPAALNIHQPRIKEIAMMGEYNFIFAYQYFCNIKKFISNNKSDVLDNLDDFDLLCLITTLEADNKQDKQVNSITNTVFTFLKILFPDYEVSFEEDKLKFIGQDGEIHIIQKSIFNEFKTIIFSICSLGNDSIEQYNPADERAKKIAEKLKKGKDKANEQNENVALDSLLSRYISILSVGLEKDMNSLFNYTVGQLKDEFERFCLKTSFDRGYQAKIAGCSGIDELENWMDNIHS